MADMKGSAVVCDDRCCCATPCPGGIACKCRAGGGRGGDSTAGMEHMACSCGEHCGCNPCTCSKSSNATASGGRGKAFCQCGAGCTCPTCAA